jgi:Skp family chaperone for outer membrane proteins
VSVALLIFLFVDVESAVLLTADGKRAQKELEAMRGKVEDELARDEAVLVRARAETAKYQKLATAYEKKVAEKQKALDEAQDLRFDPLVARIDTLMQKQSSAGVRVLDAADYPPLFPTKECDVTQELVALDAKGGHLSERPGCARRAVFYVSLDRVMASLPESKAVSARLDSFQREKQTELDQRQRAFDPDAKDADERRFELAARYEAYRRELKAREEQELQMMRGMAIAHVQKRAEGFEQALFLERIAEVPLLDRACDVTRFFSGEDRAPLGSACPAWTGSER